MQIFTDPSSRTHWVALLFFTLVLFWRSKSDFRKMFEGNSWKLDIQLLVVNQILRTLAPVSSAGIALGIGLEVAEILAPLFVGLDIGNEYSSALVVGYTITFFVLSDLSRFLLHLAMHRIPVLWKIHQVHHSATQLSPLTFYRVHPLEMFLYQLRSGIVTGIVSGVFYALCGNSVAPWTIFGVVGIGWMLNFVLGNFRHSHFFWGFPKWIECWLLSPAQHQIHHSDNPRHYNRNFGVWLAVWDRMLDTWHDSSETVSGFGFVHSSTEQSLLDLFRMFIPTKGHFGWLLFLLTLLTWPLMGLAEESDEEDGATGEGSIIVYEDNVIKEAGSAHSVSEEVLELFEWNNIESILGTVPGVSTRGEDGFGLRPNIGIRGANSDRSAKVTLMEDGILLAPAPYAAPAAYYFPMSMRLTGVEVFKGAAATRYGPQTVGGAINVLTRPIPKSKTFSNDIAMGAYQTIKWHSFMGNRFGNIGYLLEGSHLQSDGFKELPNQGDTGFYRSEFMTKVGHFNQNQQWLLKLGYAQEKSYETYLGLTQSDWAQNPMQRYAVTQKGLMQWRRTQIELSYKWTDSEHWNIQTTAYHHYLDRSWQKINGFVGDVDLHTLLQRDPKYGKGSQYLAVLRGDLNSTENDFLLRFGQNDRNYHSFGVQNVNKYSAWGDSWQNDFEFGLRVHGDQVTRNHLESVASIQEGVLNIDGTTENSILQNQVATLGYSLYGFDNLQLQKWHVLPSSRLELMQGWSDISNQSDSFRWVWLPGMGALYEISDWTDAFIGVHKGFSPVAPESNGDVRPEMSWNMELGIREHSDQLAIEGVLFWNDYQNITGACTLSSGCDIQNLGQQYNGGRAMIRGFEGVLQWEFWLPNGWTMPLDATYTWTDASFQSDFQSGFSQFGTVYTGDRLPYLASHQGNIGLRLQAESWQVGSNWQARSAMLDEAGHFGDVQEVEPLLAGDISISIQWTEHWSSSVNVNNVSNQNNIVSWRPFGARPLAPRWVMLGLEWH